MEICKGAVGTIILQEVENELKEVELTINYTTPVHASNLHSNSFLNEIELALNTIEVNITFPMRITWMDALNTSGKYIQPLEQTSHLNFITTFTDGVQTEDYVSAATELKTMWAQQLFQEQKS